MSRVNAKLKHDPPYAPGLNTVDLTADVTDVLPIANGGTETSTAPSDGRLLIGKTDGTYAVANIIAGSNIIITNDDGSIQIESTAGGAASGANSDITSMSGLTGYLQAPVGIKDSSGNIVLAFTSVASAVNWLKLTNAATGDAIILEPNSGTDTNVSMILRGMGTGTVQIGGTASGITAATTNDPLTLRGNGTGLVYVLDGADATKIIAFQCSGATTGKTLTLVTAHTDNRTITLPNATDTLVGKATTDTLTNKRITQRVVTTTDDATAVIDVDVTDVYQLSAVANATEFTVTGTPTDGQKLIVRLKDAGVSKALTWTFATAIGVTLPTATTAGKWHYIGCMYNSAASAWHAVAVATQA